MGFFLSVGIHGRTDERTAEFALSGFSWSCSCCCSFSCSCSTLLLYLFPFLSVSFSFSLSLTHHTIEFPVPNNAIRPIICILCSVTLPCSYHAMPCTHSLHSHHAISLVPVPTSASTSSSTQRLRSHRSSSSSSALRQHLHGYSKLRCAHGTRWPRLAQRVGNVNELVLGTWYGACGEQGKGGGGVYVSGVRKVRCLCVCVCVWR